ncbi:MAG: TMEM165/GDT1 family protein [Cyanobacteria bacterium J06639_1]
MHHFSFKRWRWSVTIALCISLAICIAPARAADVAEAIDNAPLLETSTPWQWIALTFATVFVAEMGDKTQLATMLMSAKEKSPWPIFIGSASALVAASAVSVLLGDWLSKLIPPEFMQLAAGGSFVVIGLFVLWQELSGSDDTGETAPESLVTDADMPSDPSNL